MTKSVALAARFNLLSLIDYSLHNGFLHWGHSNWFRIVSPPHTVASKRKLKVLVEQKKELLSLKRQQSELERLIKLRFEGFA